MEVFLLLNSMKGLVLFLLFWFSVFTSNFAMTIRMKNMIGKDKWPIDFQKNSRTLPSIEVKLDPPDDPMPQISAEIQILERSRIKMEEGLMARLEEEYNRNLDTAQSEIDDTIEKAIRIFDSKDVIKGAVKGALLPLTTNESIKNNQSVNSSGSQSSFFELNSHSLSTRTTSFLQIATSQKNKNTFDDSDSPTLQIQLGKTKAPDIEIKTKMEEIEQKRADEEAKMFEQAIAEFEILKTITLQELEKNIQIQVNPFLVDTEAVVTEISGQFPKKNLANLLKFRSLSKTSNDSRFNLCMNMKKRFQNFDVDCLKIDKKISSSFIQLSEAVKLDESSKLFEASKSQLNVRVGQSDKPYPTVDEMFSDSEKKRDATERLEQMKILKLQFKFIKAMDQMIKESLHFSLSRVIAQLAPALESINSEIIISTMK